MDNLKEEQRRLANLQSYNILDTEAEPEFDEIAELASNITGLPITLITLVDKQRQWFKSKVGLDADETAREISFCQYTIKQDSFYEVTDATKDEKFRDNPLVTDDPNIRYYLGYPIESAEGYNLGSLCVIDHKPNDLNQEQKRALEILGHQVSNLLRLRKQKQQLKVERDRANENARAKMAFLSTMSHEIRTPLNSIINFSHLLANERLSANAKQFVKNLRFASENLLSLLNDILDFNKLEANKIELNSVTFNLRELLENIRQSFSFKAKENQNEITLDWDPELPEVFQGDNHRLAQILNNLVSNATKFTENGEITLRARLLEKTNKKARLRLSVVDNGIGIPKNKQKSIFQKFTQASKDTSSKYGGTGLGLNISQRLAKLFKSELKLESEEGKGSEFYFELELPVSSRQKLKSKKLKVLKDSLENMKILVAEDNELNAQIVQRLGSMWGAEIHLAMDGKEAVEKSQEQPFDIILMDLEMPRMRGPEASAKIKSDSGPNQKTPVYAMTAYAYSSLNEMEESQYFDGLVTKPLNAARLHEVLAEIHLS